MTSSRILADAFLTGAPPTRSEREARLRFQDVVVSLRGDRNPAATVCEELAEGKPLYASLDLGVVRPNPQMIRPAFLASFLNHPTTQAALTWYRPSGVALPRLSVAALGDLDVPELALERQDVLVMLMTEAEKERRLLQRIADARRIHTDQVFAKALRGEAERPTPGGYPARAPSAQDDHATVP